MSEKERLEKAFGKLPEDELADLKLKLEIAFKKAEETIGESKHKLKTIDSNASQFLQQREIYGMQQILSIFKEVVK